MINMHRAAQTHYFPKNSAGPGAPPTDIVGTRLQLTAERNINTPMIVGHNGAPPEEMIRSLDQAHKDAFWKIIYGDIVDTLIVIHGEVLKNPMSRYAPDPIATKIRELVEKINDCRHEPKQEQTNQ